MPHCAFLTTDDLDGFVTDDVLAEAPLRQLGWSLEWVPWRARVDWERYDLVVIRTPWDYPAHLDQFLAVLAEVDGGDAPLANCLDVVRWNIDKAYLLELAARGVDVVPTVAGTDLDRDTLLLLMEELQTDEIVVKPAIGANAVDTYRCGRRSRDLDAIAAAFRHRRFLVQPFLHAVVEEGEYSAMFMGGRHSHTILKTPTAGDFRVQEEHGGEIVPADAPELVRWAGGVLKAVDVGLLYARVDAVRQGPDSFALVELELIEPSLYLRMDSAAPARFARAIDDWWRTSGARPGHPPL